MPSNSRPVSQLFVQRPDGARDPRAVPAEAAVVGGGDAGERVADGHEDERGGSEKDQKGENSKLVPANDFLELLFHLKLGSSKSLLVIPLFRFSKL